MLTTTCFGELEGLKLKLTTKDITAPAARSTGRPVDAVQLTTSSLPQLDWAAVSAPPPLPAATAATTTAGPPSYLDDDIFGLGSSSRPSAPTTTTAPTTTAPYGALSTASSASSAPPPLLLSSSSSFKVPSQATSDKHSLFFAQQGSANGGSGSFPPPPSAIASSYASGLPRYPSFEPLPPASAVASQMAQLSVAPPPPPPAAASENRYMQQPQPQGLDSLMDAPIYMTPERPLALGPQEVQVHSVAPGSGGNQTCSHPPPPPPQQPPSFDPGAQPPPAALPSDGGPKEVSKRAQLRDVHVSVALMEEFMRYALSNTSRGIETCGILAGRLSANDSVFTITTLIVPKQSGTTDTVQALNEEEIFDAQFSRELYPLGWIHTHPSQTCFLSSIDIHTQCGYQTMLDEAVAIVMAPTDSTKRCGIFRLSTPGGLSLIQKCPSRGFHAHPPTDTGQDIYELSGHVYLNPRVKHDVIDLR